MVRNQRGRQANNDKRNRRSKRIRTVGITVTTGESKSKRNRNRDRRVGTIWDPIDLSPEEIARACMQGPPKKEWDYLKKNTPPDDDQPAVL